MTGIWQGAHRAELFSLQDMHRPVLERSQEEIDGQPSDHVFMHTRSRTNRPVDETLPDFGVLVFESHHAKDFFMSFREHSFAKIFYVLEGAGTLESQRGSKPFRSGDVMVVPPKLRHRIVDAPDQPASLYVACLSLSLLSFDRSITERIQFTVLPDPHVRTRVAVTLRRMVFRQQSSDRLSSLPMVGDALRLIELVLEPRTSKRRKVERGLSPDEQSMRRYIAFLDQNFFEATTIDDAANELGMSRRHFTKLFSKHAGQSWLRFVRGRAVEHAQTRLRQTELPIASVAFECGFNDLTTFYRHFKRVTGVSPAKYRREEN